MSFAQGSVHCTWYRNSRECALLLENLSENDGHIVRTRAMAPRRDSLQNGRQHLIKRQERSFAHEILQSFNAKHFSPFVKHLGYPVRVQKNAIAGLQIYLDRGFMTHGVRERAEDHAPRLKGLFRPHYVTWSEQQQIENSAMPHLRNAIRIIAETGLRVKRELLPMKKDQIDFLNAVLWIPDSKTPNGVAEIPLTKLALEAFRDQVAISGNGEFLFPSDLNKNGHLRSLRTAWRKALKRAGVSYFRLYDLRSTYATRLSAGGVADEWVIQMLGQGDSQVFKEDVQHILGPVRRF